MKQYVKPSLSLFNTSIFESIASDCWAGGTFEINADFLDPGTWPNGIPVSIHKSFIQTGGNPGCSSGWQSNNICHDLYNQIKDFIDPNLNSNYHGWLQALHNISKTNVNYQYVTFIGSSGG